MAKKRRHRSYTKITPLSLVGLGYGFHNAYYGGGTKYDGSAGGAKQRYETTGDLGEGAKEMGYGLLENYSGLNLRPNPPDDKMFHFDALCEGWVPFGMGVLGDAILKRLRVYRAANKVLKGLGVRRLRLGSPF